MKKNELESINPLVSTAHKIIHETNNESDSYLGWVNLPVNYNKGEFSRIKKAAEKIKSDSDILLVIGIGGSYLGARAAIEMLNHSFNELLNNNKPQPQIIFVGHHLSSTYIQDLFDVLQGKDISINIISKSGTTTEPGVTFRIFRNYLEEKYGIQETKNRIYATTDQSKGALKTLARQEGYESFVIPDNIGGRFSVLTAVGLLPISVSG